MVWIKFVISLIIIFYCGRKLSQYGDTLADKTGLGKGFIGLILLGAVTSLPELITTISSVKFVKEVDLAWGNILGSNLLNLTVLSFCDIIIRKTQVIRIFDKGNVLTACFAIIITAIATLGIITGNDIVFFHSFSIYTIFILFIYISGSFILYRNAKKEKIVPKNNKEQPYISLKKIFFIFFINAVLIVAAGISITYACDEIAKITGLGSTFVGSLFLALATSLPEIVVSVSAIKLGAISMAGGNILGSNFFNVSILGFSDFFYHSGSNSLYTDASHVNLLTSTVFIIVTSIIVAGMVYRSEKRFLRFGLDSIVVIILYIFTFYYLFTAGGNV
jgi:cation:H+ antiporter